MPEMFLPAGTATGNTDAVRQGQIGPAFYLIADILTGIDGQRRMEPGMTTNDGLLGPSASFGVDIGIAADGTPYARGRSTLGQDNQATPAPEAGRPAGILPAGFKLGPVGWLVLAFIAYKVLK